MTQLDTAALKRSISYIERWLETNFGDSRFPGLAVAISHGDTVLLDAAYGYANSDGKTPLTSSHAFRVASHSKMFTAAAIMQLCEKGLVNLDDPVSKHLDWFGSAADDRVALVTIKQILGHTAGLMRDGADAAYWSAQKPFLSTTDLKNYVKDAELYFDADQAFKYSNIGYSVLGMLIEAVSGISFSEYVHNNIVGKLQLENSGGEIDGPSANPTLRASGHTDNFFNRPRRALGPINTNAMSAATGVYATATDMCKFLASHSAPDETLLSQESKQLLHDITWPMGESEELYGLGMSQIEVDAAGRASKIVYGGAPGFVREQYLNQDFIY